MLPPGVGLAAPQVGLGLRLFVIDASPFAEDDELSLDEQVQLKGFKKAFINPVIEEESGEEWAFNEGCLSIPDVREEVKRQETTISYQNEAVNGSRNPIWDSLRASFNTNTITSRVFYLPINSPLKTIDQRKIKQY